MSSATVSDHELLSILLEFQLLIRRLSNPSVLSLAESHLLSAVAFAECATVSEVAIQLGLDKSTISRSVSSLQTKGLLTNKTHSLDSRKKVVLLTVKGKALLHKDLIARSRATESLLSYLGKKEVDTLYSYLSIAAQSAKEITVVTIPGENRFRKIQRTLSRGFGLLSDNILDSGLTASALHILIVLRRTSPSVRCNWVSEHVPIAEISNHLPYPTSTIQRNLRVLLAKSLITSRLQKGSHKRPLYASTPKADRLFKQLNERISSRFTADSPTTAVSASGASIIELFYRILLKLEPVIQWKPEQVETELDLKRCRMFLVARYLKEGKDGDLPESLCRSTDLHFTIQNNKEVLFLITIPKERDASIQIAYDTTLLSRIQAIYLAEDIYKKSVKKIAL